MPHHALTNDFTSKMAIATTGKLVDQHAYKFVVINKDSYNPLTTKEGNHLVGNNINMDKNAHNSISTTSNPKSKLNADLTTNGKCDFINGKIESQATKFTTLPSKRGTVNDPISNKGPTLTPRGSLERKDTSCP